MRNVSSAQREAWRAAAGRSEGAGSYLGCGVPNTQPQHPNALERLTRSPCSTQSRLMSVQAAQHPARSEHRKPFRVTEGSLQQVWMRKLGLMKPAVEYLLRTPLRKSVLFLSPLPFSKTLGKERKKLKYTWMAGSGEDKVLVF